MIFTHIFQFTDKSMFFQWNQELSLKRTPPFPHILKCWFCHFPTLSSCFTSFSIFLPLFLLHPPLYLLLFALCLLSTFSFIKIYLLPCMRSGICHNNPIHPVLRRLFTVPEPVSFVSCIPAFSANVVTVSASSVPVPSVTQYIVFSLQRLVSDAQTAAFSLLVFRFLLFIKIPASAKKCFYPLWHYFNHLRGRLAIILQTLC